MATNGKTLTPQQLDDALVPLAVAGRVAYHQLVDKASRLSVSDDIGRALPLVAAALSAVVPIHRRVESAQPRELTSLEVEAILFRPGYEVRSVLDDLYIRRGDLHRAIETLRLAGQYFGKREP